MRKISAMLIPLSLLTMSFQVQAQPVFPKKYSGILQVQKGLGPVLYCPFKVIFKNSTEVKIVNLTTDTLDPCSSFTINSNPHPYSYDPITGDLVIDDFDITTTLTPGNCYGSLNATKDSSEIVVDSSLDGGILPGPPPVDTGDCTIVGVLNRI